METLPKQFVSAMRTLFDIMDDKHSGYVKLTDIENRWRDDRTKGLPKGVIESLQKVASHDGLLTFDRFCTGLKICLLRNQVENSSNKEIELSADDNLIHKPRNNSRPPSAPLLDVNDNTNMENNWNVNVNIPEKLTQHRTISMPHLLGRKDSNIHEFRQHSTTAQPSQDLGLRIYGPPKPPRLEKKPIERKDMQSKYKPEEVFKNIDIEVPKADFVDEISHILEGQGRSDGDGRSATELQAQLAVRRVSRRREPRRHTLHNGIDYNLLKKMKQIEQEKDILLQGLSAIEETREWYLKQLAEIQEKMRYVGRMGSYMEPWNEAQQERLELLRARVVELNRQLGALASGWRHGPLSLHMNLVLPASSLNASHSPTHAAVLRSQNRMLVEEVNRKTERISVLEREKSALIRELLLQRNRAKIMDNLT